MESPLPFADVLEAGDQLSTADKEILIEIVRHRVTERGRRCLATEIEVAEREFARGEWQPSTVDELMDEILS